MQKYGMKVLLYHATEEINFQYSLDNLVTTLLFPIEDIWSTYAAKTLKFSNRDQWVQYQEELLIQNHGTGLKLFPLWEVLQFDHNVIFFDLDIGFLFDPLPYLWQGSALTPDVITSLEVIRCKAEPNNPTADISINGRASYMPNSGTLMVRSTTAGKAFLCQWMNATVEGNWFNEQYAFTWPKGFRMAPSEGCNQLPSGLISGSKEKYVAPPLFSNDEDRDRDRDRSSIKYCFLNKYLFQTGMMVFGCRYQSYYGNISDAGIMQSVVDPKDNITKPFYFPVNVHVNARTPKSFKMKKNQMLKDLSLWLYDAPPPPPISSSSSSSSTIAISSAEPMKMNSVDLKLKCINLDVSKTRWVTKRFVPMWHTAGFFPEDQT
jgi:hypothetical protein